MRYETRYNCKESAEKDVCENKSHEKVSFLSGTSQRMPFAKLFCVVLAFFVRELQTISN